MAAFLQKTLCWLSGTVAGGQQLGTPFWANAGVLGTTSQTERWKLRTGQWEGEPERAPGSSREGRDEFTEATQVTQRPSSITGHVA